MPLKIFLAAFILAAMGCSAVKYNSHIGSDGSNGYLRTYYSSAKASDRSESTGIEHCKVQGSDIICKDLNIMLADGETPKDDSAKPGTVAPAPTKTEAPVKPPKAAKKTK